MTTHCRFLLPVVAVFVALAAAPQPAAAQSTVELAQSRGRPTIVLDRLDLPSDVPGAKSLRKYLRRRLLREARRADWGASRGNRIEFRFEVDELKVTAEKGVLRVTCAATGRLPKGKVAKSKLSFGGDPKQRRKVIRQVLEIVSRGVITRLAELERIRRGKLAPSRVRRPTS